MIVVYTEVYEKLKAACLPHIQGYHDDLLKHDLNLINDRPGMPFLHWTRIYGTDMHRLPPVNSDLWPAKGVHVPYLFGTADREHILQQIVNVARYWRDRSVVEKVHHFDGYRLHQITADEAVKIAEQFQYDMLRLWKVL